jgi:probable rRNA maturation factor
VSVLLTDDAGIRELNLSYRGQDRATDVLSFSQQEGDPMAGAPELLGDIVVSIERAAEQAARYGHSTAREVGFLSVHGLLHLLGYDHEDPDEEAVMMATAERILSRVGLVRP